ncbi:TetR/AcrR family transcriptional regulator [Nocardia sp. NPDC020380]|uniref:TetR/AcrR family transcriptional regulator n=1 Tax=Nocardia sp. NPDC020380 TaxID=3364309 RepID=UPI00379F357A
MTARSDAGAPAPVTRRPQQERGRLTRQRVLEAAVDSLAEHGWRGSSVTVIAKRAGVSRGAAQHFFPTREALFAAAIEHVTDIRLDEIRKGAADLPRGRGRTAAVIDMLSTLYTGPLFKAALQLWAAGSTEPEMRPHVLLLEAHLGRQAHRAAVDLLDIDENIPGARETIQGLLDMARGLGLADVIADDTARRRRIILQWADIIDNERARLKS